MGFSVYYRSTSRIAPAKSRAIEQAADQLCRLRTWLGCEPVCFFPGGEDGHLFGGSKPNFQPDSEDAAMAAQSPLPNGTARDLLDILSQLSRDYRIDWEISHDHSDGPIGYIRGGICDGEVMTQVEAFAEMGDMLGDQISDAEDQPWRFPSAELRGGKTDSDDDSDDEGPSILSFRPKGD